MLPGNGSIFNSSSELFPSKLDSTFIEEFRARLGGGGLGGGGLAVNDVWD